MTLDNAMQIYNAVAKFVAENPVLVALALYAVINLCKRVPMPSNPTLARIWVAFESLMVLGWEKWGGPLKTVPQADPFGGEPPTKPETPDAMSREDVLKKLNEIKSRGGK